MPPKIDRKQLHEDILVGFQGDMKAADIWKALDIKEGFFYALVKELIAAGKLERVGTGDYRVCSDSTETKLPTGTPLPGRKVAVPERGSLLIERDHRKVNIPAFLKARRPVTLFIELSPLEVESVFSLEVEMGGIWIPIELPADKRLSFDSEEPRWSPAQTTYNGVTGIRVTYANGDQYDYVHNPTYPLTMLTKD